MGTFSINNVLLKWYVSEWQMQGWWVKVFSADFASLRELAETRRANLMDSAKNLEQVELTFCKKNAGAPNHSPLLTTPFGV
jgi:hypothetical protein